MSETKHKLLFYPSNLTIGAKVFTYCQDLGIDYTSNPKEQGITAVFFNHPNPGCIYPRDKTIRALKKKYKVYNFNCTNTRKSHVAEVHKDIFGYNGDVTKKYKGRIVKKSELQYARNERLVNKVSSGYNLHYMRFIDTYKNKYYSELRVPYFNGRMQYVVQIKRRHPFDRKSKTKLVIRHISFWLHPEEIENIRKFCKAMGLDFGELDILRSKDDHRIYIVDVNDKPGFGIFKDDRVREVFTQMFKEML